MSPQQLSKVGAKLARRNSSFFRDQRKLGAPDLSDPAFPARHRLARHFALTSQFLLGLPSALPILNEDVKTGHNGLCNRFRHTLQANSCFT